MRNRAWNPFAERSGHRWVTFRAEALGTVLRAPASQDVAVFVG